MLFYIIYPPYATSVQICSILTLNFLGPRSFSTLCSMTLRVDVASGSQTVNNETVPIYNYLMIYG